MTVEVTGYSFDSDNKIISLHTVDVSEERLQWIERTRQDICRELEFQFDLTDEKAYADLLRFLHSQPRVKSLKPGASWNDSLFAVMGTVCNLSGKYVVWE